MVDDIDNAQSQVQQILDHYRLLINSVRKLYESHPKTLYSHSGSEISDFEHIKVNSGL